MSGNKSSEIRLKPVAICFEPSELGAIPHPECTNSAQKRSVNGVEAVGQCEIFVAPAVVEGDLLQRTGRQEQPGDLPHLPDAAASALEVVVELADDVVVGLPDEVARIQEQVDQGVHPRSVLGVRERYRGCLLGLAAGDAVGTTVEFSPPGTFAPVTDMVGGGPFALPIGAWTDDTSMALCLAESILEVAGFDPVDQLERYVRWWTDGHWSATGTCFDIGRATRLALQRFRKTGEPYPGDADKQAAGNGPLMKLAPVPMAFPRDAERYAVLSARTTHGAPEALAATQYFARLLVKALRGDDDVLKRRRVKLHKKVDPIAGGSYLKKK